MLNAYDVNESIQMLSFVSELVCALEFDLRDGYGFDRKVVDEQVLQARTDALYDYIFSLDYVKPYYKLKLDNKELAELSPGEKGALLLIFYLILDRGDIPLVIDQPEDNLDNQSVYKILVPFIDEARSRRQIVIVTHNPNLAVVCDSEQIISVAIDKMNGNMFTFASGSLENAEINRRVVEVLEGTMPAFNNRDMKYGMADSKVNVSRITQKSIKQ